MISFVEGDVYMWVWLSFVEIGTGIFVNSYFIECKLQRAFVVRHLIHQKPHFQASAQTWFRAFRTIKALGQYFTKQTIFS
jgi:hypothetical protein